MKIVQDDVSRLGLRRVHMISQETFGDGRVIPDGWKLVDFLEYEEEDIGVWHLWLFMKPEGDKNGNE